MGKHSGLILQDLTFVHVGNDDYLDSNGNVNFTKCWLQFDILVQMRRFRNWLVTFFPSPLQLFKLRFKCFLTLKNCKERVFVCACLLEKTTDLNP